VAHTNLNTHIPLQRQSGGRTMPYNLQVNGLKSLAAQHLKEILNII